MKLIYISPLRYPSEKAGSLFSIKSCEAFASQGIETELWVPIRRNKLKTDNIYSFFGVKDTFKIRRFFAIDFMGFLPGAFYLLSFSFAVSVFIYSLKLKINNNINKYFFYSHEFFGLLLLTYLSSETFYELHDFPGNRCVYKILFKRIKGVISTNKWKTSQTKKVFCLPKSGVFTVPNAVDISLFSQKVSMEDARERLNLDKAKYYLGYVGSLKTMGMEKGVSILIDALAFLPEKCLLYIVGGEPRDIDFYTTYAISKMMQERVIFVGRVKHDEVPLHMFACDCLIAPYPKNEHYEHYMSPMKLFEYMASQRPVIVTDLQSTREIAESGRTAVFVSPDDAHGLARAVEKLMNDNTLALRLSEAAFEEVREKYTWDRRAINIINIIESL